MPYHISERGGGAEVQSWLLAKELCRRGHDVSYVAQSINGKQNTQEVLEGVKLYWVKPISHFQWMNTLPYLRALMALNPDVVVQRMTSFMSGVIGFYCKQYQKKFVWVCTDNSSPIRWKFLKGQLKINRSVQPNILKQVIFLFNALIYDISRHYGMRHVHYPFTQNNFQKDQLQKAYGLQSHRMISGHECPASLISPEEKLKEGIVLWVANIGPQKRPEKFVEIARMAEGKMPLRFIMIGGRDDKSYLDILFLEKPKNLEWLGRLGFQKTLACFDKAAFLISTSTSEGFPNTYIQAWLRGVPVISLEADPDDVIKKNQLGIVNNDLNEIINYIATMYEHSESYSSTYNRVVKYAINNHSINKMTDNFIEIVRK